MTTVNTVPPQAYTRDTLVKALEWLASQPQTVRERANSADLVVSFYLQAKRKALSHGEVTPSQENFKSDLKHLAVDLKQFEEPSPAPHIAATPSVSIRSPSYGFGEDFFRAQNTQSVPPSSLPLHEDPSIQRGQAPSQFVSASSANAQQPAPSPPPFVQNHQMQGPSVANMPNYQNHNGHNVQGVPQHFGATQPNPNQQNSTQAPSWMVDARSWTLARRLQEKLNLSSEYEALRVLVTLGAERAKDLF